MRLMPLKSNWKKPVLKWKSNNWRLAKIKGTVRKGGAFFVAVILQLISGKRDSHDG